MKKIFMVLAVASMFIASTAMAATWIPSLNGTKASSTWDPSGLIGNMPDSLGTMGVDTNPGTVTGATGYAGMASSDFTFGVDFIEFVLGATYASGVVPAANQVIDNSFVGAPLPFTPGGTVSGTWLATMDQTTGNFPGAIAPIAIWGVNLSDTDGTDGVVGGQIWLSLAGAAFPPIALAPFDFTLTQVPVPGAVWLLLSGVLGIIGLRKSGSKSLR